MLNEILLGGECQLEKNSAAAAAAAEVRTPRARSKARMTRASVSRLPSGRPRRLVNHFISHFH